jgi:hypothetical protein
MPLAKIHVSRRLLQPVLWEGEVIPLFLSFRRKKQDLATRKDLSGTNYLVKQQGRRENPHEKSNDEHGGTWGY